MPVGLLVKTFMKPPPLKILQNSVELSQMQFTILNVDFPIDLDKRWKSLKISQQLLTPELLGQTALWLARSVTRVLVVRAGPLVPQKCSLTVFASPLKLKLIQCTLQKTSLHAATHAVPAVMVDSHLPPWTTSHPLASQLVDSMATPPHANHIHSSHANITSPATVRHVLVMDLLQLVLPHAFQVGFLAVLFFQH